MAQGGRGSFGVEREWWITFDFSSLLPLSSYNAFFRVASGKCVHLLLPVCCWESRYDEEEKRENEKWELIFSVEILPFFFRGGWNRVKEEKKWEKNERKICSSFRSSWFYFRRVGLWKFNLESQFLSFSHFLFTYDTSMLVWLSASVCVPISVFSTEMFSVFFWGETRREIFTTFLDSRTHFVCTVARQWKKELAHTWVMVALTWFLRREIFHQNFHDKSRERSTP